MGRPKKQPDERRDAQLPPVRVTAAEFAFAVEQAAAAGLDLSDFTRRRVLGLKVAPTRSATDDSVLVEMNRIGNNLNQIARALNSDRPERIDLQAALDEFRTLLAMLASRVADGP